MTERRPPNPGSDEAIKEGCTCPVLDNRHGAGGDGAGRSQFWVTEGCPLHDKKEAPNGRTK